MSELTLFGNRESGHTYKVRLLLAVAGVAHDYHEIDLTLARDERPEPFRSLAKFGEVPLLLHVGQSYVQSNAILCHLAEHLQAFGGESHERMDRAREWLFWEANRVGLSLPNLRYARKFAPSSYPGGTIDWLRGRFALDIARLDDELSKGSAFIVDDQPSIADFALCGYLFWPEQADVAVPPNVAAWLERIRALPGWRHPYDL